MANLTDRQRNLLQLVNQLNQSLIPDQNTGQEQTTAPNADMNKNVSVNVPGFDMNTGLNLDFGKPGNTNPPTQPSQPSSPQTMRDVLLNLQNDQVEITTPFGPVTGTLIAVKDNYAVLVESDGSLNLVPIDKIEQVSQL
ncbi:hypothetical protein GCM10028778_26210 [Barrientosiimonas marina]|uniref:DUF2642 domain-containing protein n=1 Tax=Lentibacillus kimchii TaxID=1542911 RepID=A0ABW2UU69_9BACI